MKWKVIHILALLALAYTIKAEDIEIPEDLDLEDADEEILLMLEAQEAAKDLARENEQAAKSTTGCSKVLCGAGRICLAKGDTASCVCIPDCPMESNPRRRVCTSKNETWPSDCEVYRQKCLCDTKDPACQDEDFQHLHIDYYGECKQMPECTEDEMGDFPRRMRDWLFNVMRDLAQRVELNDYYMQMELEAETNETRRWAIAAVWKWCDLDHNTDRSVSIHELFPIRAPLVSLEHCIAPFFDSCDTNNDHRITLKEWGACLELDENEITERCEYVHNPTPAPNKIS